MQKNGITGSAGHETGNQVHPQWTVSPPDRGFADAEFASRLERAQRMMRAMELDALLLSTEPDVRYFTGFLTQFWQSPTRPWFLVVPASGKPIAVIPEIGAALMAGTWIDDIRTWESPRPEDEGVTLLAAVLRDLSATGAGRIGVPMGPETVLRMPLADYGKLTTALTSIELTDATDLIKAVRMVKSEAEIEKVAHVCSLASDAFDRVPGIAAAGMPLVDVFGAFKLELLRRGADDVPYLVGASQPGGYDTVIAPPGAHPLQAGDVLMMDTGAVYDGYYCDFDRNYAIGHADDSTKRGYDALFRATEVGIRAARPGVPVSDLFAAMQRVMDDAGFECGNFGRMGHGLGMQLTEWPSHTSSDHTLLQAGMIITLEPSLWVTPGKGMVHEENLVIREDGARLLSRRAASELPVLV